MKEDLTVDAVDAVAPGEGGTISSAPTPAEHDTHIRTAIGSQVRNLRLRKKMTAKDLAKHAGISVALLSRLEHGSVSPSLHTLSKLSLALGVPFSALFQNVDTKGGASLVRAGKGLPVDRTGSRAGQRYELLGVQMAGDVQVEPYLITIDTKTRPFNTFQHEGSEFIYLLEGGLVYRHASNRYEMREGDSLFFDARQPHGPEEFLDIPTRFLSVISYRRH